MLGTGPGGWQMSVLLSSFLSITDTAASNETDATRFSVSSEMLLLLLALEREDEALLLAFIQS